ncbi:MAG: deoxyribonuclease IV [Ruminococcus sp.]|nr:deoxyribonuclease IV [Ruminococcus sp.]
MLNIGCHLSVSDGYEAICKEALSLGANTFQFFSRNPRGGKSAPLSPDDVKAMEDIMQKNSFAPVLAHASYTMNLCSADEKVRDFANRALKEDLEKFENMPCSLYNFHPGSHVGQGVEKGISLIADALNQAVNENQKTIVLLETMAGKGSEVGRCFEELREIIDRVNFKEKIGVCLDTCHVFDAGYDIVNDLDGVIAKFDDIIGLERLYAVHLNDSKNPVNSHKDRHEKIGEGYIGLEAITRIINHEKLRDLPFFLETPNDNQGYAEEIKLLRSKYI